MGSGCYVGWFAGMGFVVHAGGISGVCEGLRVGQ